MQDNMLKNVFFDLALVERDEIGDSHMEDVGQGAKMLGLRWFV